MSQAHSSSDLIDMEAKFAAHNYHPLPAVFARAEGVFAWDPEGKRYYDFLSAYSAVNQGHCHPKIVQALCEQAKLCTLSSRAFYNNKFPEYAKMLTTMFGYESMLPMNSGAEGVETALKLARRWSAKVKGVKEDECIILCACQCFHGRTLAAISMSCDPECYEGFGPMAKGFVKVKYDDLADLEAELKNGHGKVAAFLVEPIQGEAGVVVPKAGYLKGVQQLCQKHNALFIADEIQTGLARTGRMLATQHEDVRPDIVILGKALSGGMLPISAILADKKLMDCFTPGTHGSTFGGNPLASAVAMASLKVLVDEHMTENAEKMGHVLRDGIMAAHSPLIETVRGKGLLNAIVIKKGAPKSAWDICLMMKEKGLLAKPTHHHIIRLAPPLCITEAQIKECISIIVGVMKEVEALKPAADPHDAHGVGRPSKCPKCQSLGILY